MKTIRERLIGLIGSGDKNALLRTLRCIQHRFNAKADLLLDLRMQKRQVFLIKDMDAKENLLILCDRMLKNEHEYVSEEPWVTLEIPRWYVEGSSRESVTYEMFCYMDCYRKKMLESGTIWPLHGFVLLESILLNKEDFVKGWAEVDITVCDEVCFQDCLIDGAGQSNVIDVQEIKKMAPLPSSYYGLISGDDEDDEEVDEEEVYTETETLLEYDPGASGQPGLKEDPMAEPQQGSGYEISIKDLVGEDSDFYESTPFEKRFDPPACKVYGPIPRPLEELDKLVGLEKVKSAIDNLSTLSRYYARIAELRPDFKKPNMSKHALFLGNPGTAKTTVGNVWASILYENGVLSTGRTIVCSRETFIGRHYGDAERRWGQVIKLAKRGALLYIDEAYLMAPPEDPKDSGHCIIQYLLKAIDECPDMCVVLAGYPDKIMNMMKINPGLLGRFSLQVEVNDLDVTQLAIVTLQEFERRGYTVPEKTRDKIQEVLRIMYGERDYSWSNARECHNLVELAICKVASRVMTSASPSIEVLFTVLPEDIAFPDKYVTSPQISARRKIGFR